MDWNWASLTRLYKHYLLSYIPQNPITCPNVWFGAQPVVRQARIQYYSAFWVAAIKFGQNGLACRTSLWFSGCFWIQPSVIIFISLLYSWHYSVLIITDIWLWRESWCVLCTLAFIEQCIKSSRQIEQHPSKWLLAWCHANLWLLVVVGRSVCSALGGEVEQNGWEISSGWDFVLHIHRLY